MIGKDLVRTRRTYVTKGVGGDKTGKKDENNGLTIRISMSTLPTFTEEVIHLEEISTKYNKIIEMIKYITWSQ